MITDKQFEDLPGAVKEIVEIDRKLDLKLAGGVVPIGISKEIKELGARKRELVMFCNRTWGKSKKSDSSDPANA